MGIEAFVNYPRLKDLVVKFDSICEISFGFKGADLLIIAENCPELKSIVVGDEINYPHVEGLDDSMMEKIARSLSNIKEFKLYGVDEFDEPLTLQSIKSLGRHCPNLKELALSFITIDWEEGDGII
ncbi:hypothetical protein PG994_008156 [Apiospora phragmitis]|uniref:Uncharacterized protein n=1 Tax=Apiospora phragmitis TaxID=2905665 RepID=A0ABR1UUQ9_9PEZI